MFLKRHGRQICLRHSQRDGLGRIRQRRLGHFQDLTSLAVHLNPAAWQAWRVDFERQHPDIAVDWERLRLQAETLVQAEERRLSDAQKDGLTRQALILLLGLLDEERDQELLGQVSARLNTPPERPEAVDERAEESEDDLRRRLTDGQRALPPGRRAFDPSETTARPYLEALDDLATRLRGQGQLAESAEILKQRLDGCADETAYLEYGASSKAASLGRSGEALPVPALPPGLPALQPGLCLVAARAAGTSAGSSSARLHPRSRTRTSSGQ